jgi:hypothetical protein
MRVGGWVLAKATLAVCAGLLAALTAWVAVRRFGVTARVAVPVVAVFAGTVPLATYATQVYPEVPAALAVMAAVAALTGPLQRRGLAVLVASLVALPWLSIKYGLVAAALAAVAAARLRGRRREALATFGVLAVMAGIYLLAHRALYGGWTSYASGDFFAGNGELSVLGTHPSYLGRSRRLAGLLVDDGFGIAAWMAAWLALPFAVGALVRRRPPGWLALVAPLGAGWLTATFVALTMHGWWAPGRQVVVVLPVAVVVIAHAAERARALFGFVVLAGAIGLVTWAWTIVDAARRRHVLVVDVDETSVPWLRLWRRALPDGRHLAPADQLLSVTWWLALAGLAAWGWWSARPVLSAPITVSKVCLTTSSSPEGVPS